MRILWLTENYFPQCGGMAESCDRLVHQLRQSGPELDLAVITRKDGEMSERARLRGRDIFIPQGDSLPHALNRLWRRISAAHGARPYTHLVAFGGNAPITAAPVFAKWLEIPLVVCLRGNDFDTAIFSAPKRRILNDALEAASAICVLSAETERRVSSLFPRTLVRCIPNGIDLDAWSPLPSDTRRSEELRAELPEGKKVLGMFGHIKAKKGISFLLDALDTLALRNAYHLLIVGTLDPAVEERLSQSFVGLYSHFPFRDRFTLIPYYLCCDYVALPSLYDGLPNVLLEAGALGVPCVGTSVGGIADLLRDMPDVVFSPDSVPECRDVLTLAAHRPASARRELGTRLKDRIYSEHTLRTESDRFIRLMERLYEPQFSPQKDFLCTQP